MNKITIVGQNGAPDQVFDITYRSGTDLLQGISAPGSGTTYGYDPRTAT